MIEGTGGSAIIFDIMAVFLAVNIVFWFTWATYYSVKRILIYRKKKEPIFFLTYLNLITSVLFVIIFWYIIIATIVQGTLIENTSFGAVAIRPLILLEAVGTAISEMEKYRKERK